MYNISETGFTELTFIVDKHYDNPLWDMELKVKLVSRQGCKKEIQAFWDGGNTWRARIGADFAGVWEYTVTASDPTYSANGLTGSVTVVPYKPLHTLWEKGGLSAKPNGFRLAYSDGAPFFWMADTAWNGVLKAGAEDWEYYLRTRYKQGFTAVQCVLTQWRAYQANSNGETAFSGTQRIQINPRFFAALDDKVAAINRCGLVAGLVLLWACKPSDPGHYLPSEAAQKLAEYIVARYNCHQVVWFLGGDGNYAGEAAQRWHHIGRQLFGAEHDRLVTMHPGGQQWVANDFRGEQWYSFVGYQSGHGDAQKDLRWLVAGHPTTEWRKTPPCPVIDLEPNYEAHLAYKSHRYITPQMVRRALYWNLLITPTAGVTYGHNSVWPWMEQRGYPMDHPGTGLTNPWRESLYSIGACSVTHLRRLFETLPWSELCPAPELLLAQPGDDDPTGFVAVAKAEDGSVVVAYLPEGGSITLDLRKLPQLKQAVWHNPEIGISASPFDIDQSICVFTAPDNHDWVLLVREA